MFCGIVCCRAAVSLRLLMDMFGLSGFKTCSKVFRTNCCWLCSTESETQNFEPQTTQHQQHLKCENTTNPQPKPSTLYPQTRKLKSLNSTAGIMHSCKPYANHYGIRPPKPNSHDQGPLYSAFENRYRTLIKATKLV